MGDSNPKRLVVEGQDDKFSVASLMGFHTAWADKKEDAPVHIINGNGVDEILNNKYLATRLKEPGLSVLGIMLDADKSLENRYNRIRQEVSAFFPELPAQLPAQGLIVENADGLRLGTWIMPDNKSDGDLELFLKRLVPEGDEACWKYALEAVRTARDRGCSDLGAHTSKGNLYTWLAWQDPPGQSPGMALTKKILDPHSKTAAAFVQWFMELYQLPPLEQPKLVLT